LQKHAGYSCIWGGLFLFYRLDGLICSPMPYWSYRNQKLIIGIRRKHPWYLLGGLHFRLRDNVSEGLNPKFFLWNSQMVIILIFYQWSLQKLRTDRIMQKAPTVESDICIWSMTLPRTDSVILSQLVTFQRIRFLVS
jgi:hypothetical protein